MCFFLYLIFCLFIVLGRIIIICCNFVIRFVLLYQFHRGAYRFVDISYWFVCCFVNVDKRLVDVAILIIIHGLRLFLLFIILLLSSYGHRSWCVVVLLPFAAT